MARETERVGMMVSLGTVARLRALAASLGLVARNGLMVGQGSLSQLCEAIGGGRLVVTWAEGKAPQSEDKT